MERRKTLVHFLGAIFLVIFAVVLFKIKSGDIIMAHTPKADGSYDYSGLIKLTITFTLCILAFAGLITVLNDGEFMAWLSSAGIIVAFGVVGVIFDIGMITGALIAGVYCLWWSIASIKSLIANWDSYMPCKIMAICRVVLAVMLGFFVLVWLSIPVGLEPVSGVYTWAGVLSIIGAVAMFIEGCIWFKYCDY